MSYEEIKEIADGIKSATDSCDTTEERIRVRKIINLKKAVEHCQRMIDDAIYSGRFNVFCHFPESNIEFQNIMLTKGYDIIWCVNPWLDSVNHPCTRDEYNKRENKLIAEFGDIFGNGYGYNISWQKKSRKG